MKDCENCEHSKYYSDVGYDCGLDEDEPCPYNDEADVKRDGISIVIDAGRMEQYIRNTIRNTVEKTAREVAEREIRGFITDEIRRATQEAVEASVARLIDEEIARYFAGEMTVGGDWRNPARTVTRLQYMQEVITNTLDGQLKNNPIGRVCEEQAKRLFRDWCDKLKRDINDGIKDVFTDAMRQTLTDNVVNLLMSNETYSRLAGSVQRLIP